MTFEMIKYPKIGQLKDAAYEVNRRHEGIDLPTLRFEGTVKLHGTNACIVFQDRDIIGYQSRNRKLTLEKDNAGFVAWCEARKNYLRLPEGATGLTYVYGEFCGGNIQKGVGITGLEKMFVAFEDHGIIAPDFYKIGIFRSWELSVNMADTKQIVNDLRVITEDVEKECPVAAEFHIKEGTGEGVVWKCITPGYEDIMFKVKGQEHSKSNVKELTPVDLALHNELIALAKEIITEGRCQQGLEYLKEMQLDFRMQSIGQFLKYVVSDALVEEKLLIEASGKEPTKIGKYCNQVAKDWYLKALDNQSTQN